MVGDGVNANVHSGWDDEKIKVTINVPSGLDDLELKLTSNLSSPISDESWGIDNFTIDLPSGSDVLSASSSDLSATGITATYDGSTKTLTLTKPEGGTAAEFEQVLRSVEFSNASDAPDPNTRTLIVSTTNSSSQTTEHDTAQFTVTRVNDQPAFDEFTSLNYTENDSAKAISPDAVIIDVDESTDFDGGYVLAQLIAGSEASDQLSILESGGISLSGNLVQYTVDSITTEIGAIDNSFDGVNQNDLKIHLSQHATHEATQALIRAIAYHNTSDDPSSGLSNNDRTVRFILNDGGNTSGIDPVDQADSALECSVDVSIIFTSVNDAPGLTYSVGGTWSEAISGDSDPLLVPKRCICE